MEFIRIPGLTEGAAPLHDRLVEELEAGKKVIWLLTGGSSMALSVEVMRDIPEDLTGNLTLYLTDERYGEVGHPDSNARQLADAGFNPKNARQVFVLSDGLTLEETTEQYALSIGAAFEAADVVIAQIGLGSDGHVLGVLPGTPGVNSDELVVGYQSEPFTRVTLTLSAVRQYVDAAYVFAFGEEKRRALTDLLTRDMPLDEQPAQILKQLPEAYVYNDLMEGTA